MNSLILTLSKLPFDIMVTGEKKFEYRKPSKWIKSRLFNKDGSRRKYDTVTFKNGYSSESPFFISEFIDFWISDTDYHVTFQNSLKVNIDKGDIVIILGDLVSCGNLHL